LFLEYCDSDVIVMSEGSYLVPEEANVSDGYVSLLAMGKWHARHGVSQSFMKFSDIQIEESSLEFLISVSILPESLRIPLDSK
jgi:hypothetical protein